VGGSAGLDPEEIRHVIGRTYRDRVEASTGLTVQVGADGDVLKTWDRAVLVDE
jgi:hypothetical protein